MVRDRRELASRVGNNHLSRPDRIAEGPGSQGRSGYERRDVKSCGQARPRRSNPLSTNWEPGRTPLSSRDVVVAAANELVARGIEMVVVSMGHEGASFVGAEGILFATPPEIEVRSTVGAGDAMVAGVVSAKLRGLALAGPHA